MILTKQLFLSIAILLASHLSLSAQSDAWRPSEHYTNMVTQFENRNDIDTSTIVMLGNSLTEFGGDWSKKLGRPGIVNYGIMGDNTQGMLRRLYQITPHHPKAIFLMVGTNDVTGEETDEEIFEKCRSVIDAIRTQTPQTRLLVQSLLPVNLEVKLWKILEGQEAKIVDINHRLQDYCERQQLEPSSTSTRSSLPRTDSPCGQTLPQTGSTSTRRATASGPASCSPIWRKFSLLNKRRIPTTFDR